MIDYLNGFINLVKNNENMLIRAIGGGVIECREFKPCTDELFCPKCGAVRRCDIKNETWDVKFRYDNRSEEIVYENLPCLFKATCLQCESETLLLIYNGPEEVELAVLHDTYSGCVTPNTPKEVKYYIDQAFRARSVGAVSAAMSMYRSALEWLLYEQGFTGGMLNNKIQELDNRIKNSTAPKWATEIDTDFLIQIKNIGNGAMHTNGGDITKQNNIDNELLELIDIVFSELLDKIYEQPLRSKSNLEKLREKSLAIKK